MKQKKNTIYITFELSDHIYTHKLDEYINRQLINVLVN